MKRFKILVPVDFSDMSTEALVWAISMARKIKADVTLVTVIEWPVASDASGFFAFYDADQARRALTEDRLRELAQTSLWFSAHPPKVTARLGQPVDQIMLVAEQEDSDLIVMGTHGRRGFSRFFLGSVAEGVIQRSPCPVTVLRGGVKAAGVGGNDETTRAVHLEADTPEHRRRWWSGD